MAKKYKNMSHPELWKLCRGHFVFKKKPTKKEMIKLLEASEKTKPKIEQVEIEPELSETPIIKDEQATAPVEPIIVPEKVPELPSVGETMKPQGLKRMPLSVDEIPVTKRPAIPKEPAYVEPAQPVICSGCGATVEADTVRACPTCPRSLVFCPTCAKPGTCHKCGKGLK